MKKQKTKHGKKMKKSDLLYERFLQLLKWALLLFAAYIVLNVTFKTVWNVFHLDGSLRMQGAQVKAEENWLVCNHRTAANPRYFRYAQIQDVPGYTRLNETLLADPNESDFLFEAQDPANAADQIYVAVATERFEQACASARQRMADFYTDGAVGEMSADTLYEKNACFFTYQYPMDDATLSGLNVYFDTGERSVVVTITDKDEDNLFACLDLLMQGIRFDR